MQVIVAKISDNVLEDKDHSELELNLQNNRVVGVKYINKGVYLADVLVGMSLADLSLWTAHCDESRHPQSYNELWDPMKGKFLSDLSIDDVEDCIIRR